MNDEVTLNDATLGEQGEQDAQTVESSTTETQDTGEQTQEQDDKPKKEFWAKKRIDELTREKYEAKRAAEQAAIEVQQLREAMQQGQQAPLGDVQSLVQQEAQRLIAEQSFDAACNKTYDTGIAEFPDFKEAYGNLSMIGITRDFIEVVVDSDPKMAATVLHHLGNDLDEAARISSLPPIQMARELTKLEHKLSSQPAPKKQISNAPDPIKPLSAAGATATKDPAKMTDTEFAKWRREQIKARNG